MKINWPLPKKSGLECPSIWPTNLGELKISHSRFWCWSGPAHVSLRIIYNSKEKGKLFLDISSKICETFFDFGWFFLCANIKKFKPKKMWKKIFLTFSENSNYIEKLNFLMMILLYNFDPWGTNVAFHGWVILVWYWNFFSAVAYFTVISSWKMFVLLSMNKQFIIINSPFFFHSILKL